MKIDFWRGSFRLKSNRFPFPKLTKPCARLCWSSFWQSFLSFCFCPSSSALQSVYCGGTRSIGFGCDVQSESGRRELWIYKQCISSIDWFWTLWSLSNRVRLDNFKMKDRLTRMDIVMHGYSFCSCPSRVIWLSWSFPNCFSSLQLCSLHDWSVAWLEPVCWSSAIQLMRNHFNRLLI